MGTPSTQDWANLSQQQAAYRDFLEQNKWDYFDFSSAAARETLDLGGHPQPAALTEVRALAVDRKMRVEQRLQERLAGNEDYAYFVQEMENKGWITHEFGQGPERQLVDRWSVSSTDNVASVLLQRLAVDEFGLTDTPMGHFGEVASYLADDAMRGVANPDQFAAGGRAFLREMYNETQAELAAAGITELTVVRGMSVQEGAFADVWEQGSPGPGDWGRVIRTGVAEVDLQPMSSFSTSVRTANDFTDLADAPGYHGVVMAMKVPASQVLATPLTGYGCLHEHEVVVLGGTGQVVVNLASQGIKGHVRQLAMDDYFNNL